LITRSAEGDSFDVMGPIAAVQPATDHQAYLGYLRRPELAAATITVSEAGYLRGPDGHLDLGRAVITADLAALQGNIEAPVSSLPGKLVAGLLARQTWMEQNVDFATSMVDRITPATTAEERSLVAKAQGYEDASPVPTEPFAEWVISGRFPNGRAAWEDAGARLVEDITPYEQRKLWLLNASHSLLAYAGSICGHATIDEAIGDPQCRSWVEALWEESCRHLTLPAAMLADYRRIDPALCQPPGTRPAEQNRRRWVTKAASGDPAPVACRTRRQAYARRLRHRRRGLDLAQSGDRAITDDECARDLAIALTSCNEAKHLHLSHGKSMSICANTPRKHVDAREVRPRIEPNKSVARCGELKSGRLRIIQRTEGLGQQHARSCRLVRRLELLPRMQRLLQ
jgi:hypothetical protein